MPHKLAFREKRRYSRSVLIVAQAGAHEKRVSPRIVEFWRAFYEEVNRRIDGGSTNENLLSFNLLDVIFEVNQGDAYFRKVKALFNEARPRAKQLEPPRDSQRLQFLRGWSNGKETREVPSRGS